MAKHWERLVRAMDEEDAQRIQELVPHAQYVKIPANHGIHRYKAEEFNQAIVRFAIQNELLRDAHQYLEQA